MKAPALALISCMSLACVVIEPGGGDGDGDTASGDDTSADTETGTDTETATDTATDTDTGDPVCVGVEPLFDDPGEPCPECAPYWDLYDFQPQSCGFEQTYGMDSFEGHVTLVALLAGWCSYCQSQATKMEQMRLELALDGYPAQFIAVNAVSADNVDDQQKLIDRCAFPLFQDTDEQGAWALHGGSKDDIFVYRADGTLAAELFAGGDVPTNLSTAEGYDAVKQTIIDAF